jgi:calcineurin-like phosphoesterase family protein
MTIWFTSDTHFNHANIIEYSHRPYADLHEMTEAIISRWNRWVKPGDTVYHLGDFALSWGRKHWDTIDEILGRLSGQKWLIRGNHDRDEVVKNPRWHAVRDYHEIKVDLGGKHKQRIVMSHYAMRAWNQCHRGAWMLHGHSHGNLPDIGGKIWDVGVDCHEFLPVPIEALQSVMAKREILSSDHHQPTTGCDHYPADDDNAAVPAGMEMRRAAVIAEACAIAQCHPSKDARSFAESVIEQFGHHRHRGDHD